MTYLKELLKSKRIVKIIPLNWCPTRFFYFQFRGWKVKDLSEDNSELLDSIKIASASLEAFYSTYEEEYAFTEAIFSLDKDFTLMIKIAIMPLEQYEKMCEKYQEV